MSELTDEKKALGLALAKVRDGLQGLQPAIEAIDEYLNLLGKPMEGKEQKSWDPGRIKWTQDTGTKGPYDRYPGKDQKAEASADYKNMLQDLKDHKGAMNRDGFFYWVFQDQATVGRRKKQQG